MKGLIHFCPFCSGRLNIWVHEFYTSYGCVDDNCVNDDMPRYQITYNNYPTFLIGYTFMLDKYYIQINYPNQITTISRLEACFLFDNIELPTALIVDFNNLETLLNKIKTILTFS
jgi:hypothetical protein